MQNAADYLDKTRSAAAKLFEGIDTYLALLRQHSTTFVTSYTTREDFQRQYDAWCEANRSNIQAAFEAQKQYLGGRRQLAWPVDDNYLGRLDL